MKWRFFVFLHLIVLTSNTSLFAKSENPFHALLRFCLGKPRPFLGTTVSNHQMLSGDVLQTAEIRLREEAPHFTLRDLAGQTRQSIIRIALPEDAPHIAPASRVFLHYGLQVFFFSDAKKSSTFEVRGVHQRHSHIIEISEIIRSKNDKLTDQEIIIGFLGAVKILYADHGYTLETNSPVISGAVLKLWILFEKLGYAEATYSGGYPHWKFKEDILKSSALDKFAQVARKKLSTD